MMVPQNISRCIFDAPEAFNLRKYHLLPIPRVDSGVKSALSWQETISRWRRDKRMPLQKNWIEWKSGGKWNE